MQGQAGDGEQPQTDLPAPGWYADPSGDGGIRWWTGSEWAQRAASGPQVQLAGRKRLGPANVWLADTMSVCLRVSSDLFALIAVLLVPAFLAFAGATWYTLREAAVVVVVDPDTEQLVVEETRGGAEIAQGAFLVALTLGLVWIGGSLLAMASSVQALQSQADRPATWLESLAPLRQRVTSVAGAIAAFILFSSFMTYVWFSGHLVAVLLMLPSIPIAIWVWTTYSFVPVASVAGPQQPSVFKQSSLAVSGRFFELLRRFLFLGTWTALASMGFLFLSRLISSGAAEDPSLAGTRDKYVFSFSGSFGDNLYLWLLLAVLSSIFWGAVISVWSGATALLYTELEGDVEIRQHALRREDAE